MNIEVDPPELGQKRVLNRTDIYAQTVDPGEIRNPKKLHVDKKQIQRGSEYSVANANQRPSQSFNLEPRVQWYKRNYANPEHAQMDPKIQKELYNDFQNDMYKLHKLNAWEQKYDPTHITKMNPEITLVMDHTVGKKFTDSVFRNILYDGDKDWYRKPNRGEYVYPENYVQDRKFFNIPDSVPQYNITNKDEVTSFNPDKLQTYLRNSRDLGAIANAEYGNFLDQNKNKNLNPTQIEPEINFPEEEKKEFTNLSYSQPPIHNLSQQQLNQQKITSLPAQLPQQLTPQPSSQPALSNIPSVQSKTPTPPEIYPKQSQTSLASLSQREKLINEALEAQMNQVPLNQKNVNENINQNIDSRIDPYDLAPFGSQDSWNFSDHLDRKINNLPDQVFTPNPMPQTPPNYIRSPLQSTQYGSQQLSQLPTIAESLTPMPIERSPVSYNPFDTPDTTRAVLPNVSNMAPPPQNLAQSQTQRPLIQPVNPLSFPGVTIVNNYTPPPPSQSAQQSLPLSTVYEKSASLGNITQQTNPPQPSLQLSPPVQSSQQSLSTIGSQQMSVPAQRYVPYTADSIPPMEDIEDEDDDDSDEEEWDEPNEIKFHQDPKPDDDNPPWANLMSDSAWTGTSGLANQPAQQQQQQQQQQQGRQQANLYDDPFADRMEEDIEFNIDELPMPEEEEKKETTEIGIGQDTPQSIQAPPIQTQPIQTQTEPQQPKTSKEFATQTKPTLDPQHLIRERKLEVAPAFGKEEEIEKTLNKLMPTLPEKERLENQLKAITRIDIEMKRLQDVWEKRYANKFPALKFKFKNMFDDIKDKLPLNGDEWKTVYHNSMMIPMWQLEKITQDINSGYFQKKDISQKANSLKTDIEVQFPIIGDKLFKNINERDAGEGAVLQIQNEVMGAWKDEQEAKQTDKLEQRYFDLTGKNMPDNLKTNEDKLEEIKRVRKNIETPALQNLINLSKGLEKKYGNTLLHGSSMEPGILEKTIRANSDNWNNLNLIMKEGPTKLNDILAKKTYKLINEVEKIANEQNLTRDLQDLTKGIQSYPIKTDDTQQLEHKLDWWQTLLQNPAELNRVIKEKNKHKSTAIDLNTKFETLTKTPFDFRERYQARELDELSTEQLKDLQHVLTNAIAHYEKDLGEYKDEEKNFYEKFSNIKNKIKNFNQGMLPNDYNVDYFLNIKNNSVGNIIASFQKTKESDPGKAAEDVREYIRNLENLNSIIETAEISSTQKDLSQLEKKRIELSKYLTEHDEDFKDDYENLATSTLDQAKEVTKDLQMKHKLIQTQYNQIQEEIQAEKDKAIALGKTYDEPMEVEKDSIQYHKEYLNKLKSFNVQESKNIKDTSAEAIAKRILNYEHTIAKFTGRQPTSDLETLKKLNTDQLDKELDNVQKNYKINMDERNSYIKMIAEDISKTHVANQQLKDNEMVNPIPLSEVYKHSGTIQSLENLHSKTNEQKLLAEQRLAKQEMQDKEDTKLNIEKMYYNFKKEETVFRESQTNLRHKELTAIKNTQLEYDKSIQELQLKTKQDMLNSSLENKRLIQNNSDWLQMQLATYKATQVDTIQKESRQLQRDLQKADLDTKKTLQKMNQDFLTTQNESNNNRSIAAEWNHQKHVEEIQKLNHTHKEQLEQNHQTYLNKFQSKDNVFKKAQEFRSHVYKKKEIKILSQAKQEENKEKYIHDKKMQELNMTFQKGLKTQAESATNRLTKLQYALSDRGERNKQYFELQRRKSDKIEKKEIRNEKTMAQQLEINSILEELQREKIPTPYAAQVTDPEQGAALVNNYRRLLTNMQPTKNLRFKLNTLRKWFVENDKEKELTNSGLTLASSHEINQMGYSEAKELYDIMDSYREEDSLKHKSKLKATQWSHELTEQLKDLKEIQGETYSEIDSKITVENQEEYLNAKHKLQNRTRQDEKTLESLNQTKIKLYEAIENQRKEISPDLRKHLNSLSKYHSYSNLKNKLLSGNIKDSTADVNELRTLLEEESEVLKNDKEGRFAEHGLDTYVNALQTITGDTSAYYKILSNAGHKKPEEVKVDPSDFKTFESQAKTAFEIAAKNKYINRGNSNRLVVNHIIEEAKNLFEKTNTDKDLTGKWEKVAESLNNETATRGAATVQSLAKNPTLSEIYLISLAQDISQKANILNKENPIKLYTALKSLGVQVNTNGFAGKAPAQQAELLLQQIPPRLFSNPKAALKAIEIDSDDAKWHRQIANVNSYSENYFKNNMITGNSVDDIRNSITHAPGYKPGTPISRLDFGTGNFYPSSLKNIKTNEAYFINKPKDIKNLYSLKKDSILHNSNKLISHGLAFAQDKKRRMGTNNLNPNHRGLNLANFLNALPGSKKFLNKKEKFIANLHGKQKRRPKKKTVAKKVLQHRKKRKIEKVLKAKPVKKMVAKVKLKNRKNMEEEEGGLIEIDSSDDELIFKEN